MLIENTLLKEIARVYKVEMMNYVVLGQLVLYMGVSLRMGVYNRYVPIGTALLGMTFSLYSMGIRNWKLRKFESVLEDQLREEHDKYKAFFQRETYD